MQRPTPAHEQFPLQQEQGRVEGFLVQLVASASEACYGMVVISQQLLYTLQVLACCLSLIECIFDLIWIFLLSKKDMPVYESNCLEATTFRFSEVQRQPFAFLSGCQVHQSALDIFYSILHLNPSQVLSRFDHQCRLIIFYFIYLFIVVDFQAINAR